MKTIAILIVFTVFLSAQKPVADTGFSHTSGLIDLLQYNYQGDTLSLLKSDFTGRSDLMKRDVNYTMLAGLSAVYFGAGLGVYLYQNNAWWANNRRSFHFIDDWEYVLWNDKLGHIWATLMLGHAFSVGLEAAEVDYETNIWVSSSAALLFQLFVEYQDGFASDWGFSRGDAYADLVGAAFPVIQYYYPPLYNYQMRFSYIPDRLGKEGLTPGQQVLVMDDYGGHKFWLAVKMENLLPESLKKYWPDFLMLSLGYGVRNLDGSGGGLSDLYISLDYDYEFIPLYGKFWQMVKNTLGYIKTPAPAIRITNGVAFFGLMF